MAISMKDHASKIGGVGKLYDVVGVPWPIKVQVIDIRQNYGQVNYLVADATAEDGPGTWVAAWRVRMEEGEGGR